MKFIPLYELKELTSTYGNVLEADGRMAILEHYRGNNLENGPYSNAEITEIVASLTAEKIVFYGWIDQNQELILFLKGNKPNRPFKDTNLWLAHAMANNFSAFISPFLVKACLQFNYEKNLSTLNCLFSFLQLMSLDERMVVEQVIYKNIDDHLNDLFGASNKAESEDKLLQLTEQICSKEITEIINHLSRASYHLKVGYIDKTLCLFDHPQCTPRLGYRIVTKLHTLELNPEHQAKLKAIEAELKSGELLQNKIKRKHQINYRQIVSFFALIIIVFTAYFIINYQPEQSKNDDLNSASSFEKFTKEERMQLDSLLRSSRGSIEENKDDRDKYLWSQGNGTSLSLRSTLKNDRMEELYTDWLADALLHENGAYDSCVPTKTSKQNFQFPGVQKANELLGKEEILIQNNSDYTIYIFIFDDFKNGVVSSQLLKKNETIQLKMSVGNNLLFVAGKNLVNYKAPKNGINLPSKNFDHHFCEVDYNMSESLFTIYKLIKPQLGKNKLMLSGDSTNYFVVADLYGILETI